MNEAQALARERQWSTRSGLAAIAGGALGLAGFILLQGAIQGGANFEGLQDAHDNASLIWLAGVATAIGYALLTVPLFFLFKAAQARAAQVRNQFAGLVLLGPLLLAVSALALAGGTQEAANTYIDGDARLSLSAKEATDECEAERKDEGAGAFADDFGGKGPGALAACESKKQEEDRASNAIRDATLVGVGQYAGLAGGFALVAALFYTGLWSMRTGLLSRFWGSLGMAVGITILIGFSPLVFLWFVYLGILLIGALPGGRPPAWDAGTAIPWPTPGEKAAKELSPSEETDPALPSGDGDGDPNPSGERRKRKQRD